MNVTISSKPGVRELKALTESNHLFALSMSPLTASLCLHRFPEHRSQREAQNALAGLGKEGPVRARPARAAPGAGAALPRSFISSAQWDD